MYPKKIALWLGAGLLACTAATGALAQDAAAWPQRAVTLIVPFPAGGGGDTLARLVADPLSRQLGQPLIIENRPGGTSFIATDAVAHSPADGYTLLVAFFGTLVVNPSLYNKLPYDPVKDFAPVTTVANLPLMLVVNPQPPIHSIRQLIELSKEKPNRFTFASGGAGQGAHLAGEMLKNMAGISLIHVPYKGNAPAVMDLLGNHVDMLFDGMTSSLPYVKSGRLRAIAVSTLKRASAMPDLPTVAESGLPGFDVGSWFGILAPAHTPVPVIAKLNTELVRIINSPDFTAQLRTLGLDPMTSTPTEFAAYMRQETAKWAKVVHDAHIKID